MGGSPSWTFSDLAVWQGKQVLCPLRGRSRWSLKRPVPQGGRLCVVLPVKAKPLRCALTRSLDGVRASTEDDTAPLVVQASWHLVRFTLPL
jgi:hypothetical protein